MTWLRGRGPHGAKGRCGLLWPMTTRANAPASGLASPNRHPAPRRPARPPPGAAPADVRAGAGGRARARGGRAHGHPRGRRGSRSSAGASRRGRAGRSPGLDRLGHAPGAAARCDALARAPWRPLRLPRPPAGDGGQGRSVSTTASPPPGADAALMGMPAGPPSLERRRCHRRDGGGRHADRRRPRSAPRHGGSGRARRRSGRHDHGRPWRRGSPERCWLWAPSPRGSQTSNPPCGAGPPGLRRVLESNRTAVRELMN